MLYKIIFFYCLISAKSICTAVYHENSHYTAAVVEYNPGETCEICEDELLIINARNHIDLLKNISHPDLELIVFPEKTLIPNGDVTIFSTPLPKAFDTVLCTTDGPYKEFLKLFSCAAIEHNVSIIISIIEKEELADTDGFTSGQANDVFYYNTIVVFNENGSISGRYRKWNLFGEFQLSTPNYVDITVITTKNNVSFGIITCFDIIFNIPAKNLIKDLKIKNIIFPNNWISELPYLTALQVQQMWSQENNIVLLAAGANNPKKGASGSGIFLGDKGPMETAFIGGTGGTKLLVQTIPHLDTTENLNSYVLPINEDTDYLAKDLDDFFLLRDLSMNDHTAMLMNENEPMIKTEVCNGDSNVLCCKFELSINFNKNLTGKYRYKYHLVAFNGIRSFSGLRYAGIETCGVVACLNDTLSSCALRFSNYSEIFWPITFEKIQVEAKYVMDENRTQYPNSLLASMRPILPRYTTWEKEDLGSWIKRRHTLNKSENRLLTFGIFGRDFSQDSSLLKPNSGSNFGKEYCYLPFFYVITTFMFHYIHY